LTSKRFNGLKVDGFSRGAGAADFQSTLKRASPITLRLAPALKRWSSKPSGKASEDAYLRSWVNELQTASVPHEGYCLRWLSRSLLSKYDPRKTRNRTSKNLFRVASRMLVLANGIIEIGKHDYVDCLNIIQTHVSKISRPSVRSRVARPA